MKILKVWPFWQDKLKYHDHYLAAEMQRLGHETTFLAPNRVEASFVPFVGCNVFPAEVYIRKHFRVVRLSSIDIHGKFIITDIRKAARCLREGFEVVHIFGISNFITFLVLTLLIMHKRRPLVLINDHSHPQDHKNSLLGRAYYELFRALFLIYSPMISRVIVPNLASKVYLAQRYRLKDDGLLKIIPLGFYQDVFNLDAGARNCEPRLVVCFAGKIYPEKRLELLLGAVSNFDASQISLIIAGNNPSEPSPYQRMLMDEAIRLGISNVEFRPFISEPEELARFYAYADVAVFPGSISITTLEASGCGTPVVLYRSTEGLEDRVDHGLGVLFDTEADLVGILRTYILAKHEGTIDHAEICAQSQRMSWKHIAQLYIDEYRSLSAH